MPHFGPYGEIHRLQAEVNRLIESLMDQRRLGANSWQPPLDIVVGDESTRIAIELPGVLTSDISVEVIGRSLKVSGRKQRLASEPSGGNYHLMERFFGAFDLTVELPRAVDPREVHARMCDGVLQVTMPHLQERRRRNYVIEVQEDDE